MDQNNAVIAVTVNIGELIIGTLVEETDEYIKLAKAVIPSAVANGGKVGLNLFHADMICTGPPLGNRNFIKNPNEELFLTIHKSRIFFRHNELSESIIQTYNNFFGKIPEQFVDEAKDPDKNIINLF